MLYLWPFLASGMKKVKSDVRHDRFVQTEL